MGKLAKALIKCVIYCRFSPRPDALDSLSNVNQEIRCREYAASKGYEVVAVVYEDDTTGAYDDNSPDPAAFYQSRPKLYEALSMVKKDMIFLCRWRDRIARSVHAQGVVRMEIASKGAKWEAADESNEETPEGKFIQTIYAGMAELRRWQIKISTSRGMLRNQAAGQRMTRKDRCPFGWGPDPKDLDRLIEIPDEQITLQMIRDADARGLSLRQICNLLDNARRGRRGKFWEDGQGTVRAILRRDAGLPRRTGAPK